MNDRTNAVRQPTMAPLLPGLPGLAWTEIRQAAVDCAARGWPVLPGTYQLAEHAGWLGKPGAVGLEPVAELWPLAATLDPDRAMDWWTRRPYSVLLACGTSVSAIEVPAVHGRRALAHAAGQEAGPVAATPFGSWLFFMRSDDGPLRPELADPARAQLHDDGTWLPLPPSAREGRPYRWRVSPSSVRWTLPTSTEVQRALVASLRRPHTNAEPGTA